MASSSSYSDRQWIYDVFINFRGLDTREGFVSHLHSALCNAGVNTFLDDTKLGKGTELGPELARAIEGSRIAIVVFSKHYGYSVWCLNELVKILEYQKTNGQVVLPVFFDVPPSDVREQKGAFGEAFRESNFLLPNWKTALTQAANLSGWDVKNYRTEADVVKKIVEDVLTKLDCTLLSITDFPVGLESRKQEVIEFIENRSKKVCKVGIWGMGGSGKTTTAKAVYNQILRKFDGACFIENIREVCEKDSTSRGGIMLLQKQLLSDVLKEKVKVNSISMGTSMIERRLRGKKVLIVLDDVNKFDQLQSLCGNSKWMDSGSLLIVTTRDARVLTLLDVHHVFEMKEMDKDDSLELFSWHAFREANPIEDFGDLSRNVVAYCGGLPLALEVIGSCLYHRTKPEWESVLSKLEKIPDDQVHEKLRISFDGLMDDKQKNIFLDICCFFVGKDRAYVTNILNDCGLHPEIGITVLAERSLIKVEKNNKLTMHDLVRHMGREVIRQSSLDEPEKRSRLWAQEDVLGVLREFTGTQAIEGLALKLEKNDCFSTKAFENMKKLRLFQLDHVELDGDYANLPRYMRWVYWQGFRLKYIPDSFYQGNVVAIDMKHSNLRLVWKKSQLLEKLKILNLSHSKYLTNTPDFSNLPNLEKLIFKDCQSLSEVHQSIGHLKNLHVFNFKDCTSLKNLPMTFYESTSIKTLDITGCSKIDKLEDGIGQMQSLTTLLADKTGIKRVPFSIVRSKKIGYISLCGYEGLAHDVFPSLIWSWMSPTTSLVSAMQPFGNMSTSIVSVDIQDNNLGGLLSGLDSFSQLRSIWVKCDSESQLTGELRKILEEPSNINVTNSESTSVASQISETSIGSHLIGMGSYNHVMDLLSKNISKGLTSCGSDDFVLPGDNSPHWLAYTGEGRSVSFQVPKDSDCCLNGMTLCIVYSSTLENMAASVLIINYTKYTIQIYKRDTTMSFNDEDWQSIISNLGPGDNVGFVVFGHGMIVKKIAVYLIYDQSEPLADVNLQPSATVTIEPSSNVKTDPSPHMKIEPSPEVNVHPSHHATIKPSSDVKMDLLPDVKMKPETSQKPNKNFCTRLKECLFLRSQK